MGRSQWNNRGAVLFVGNEKRCKEHLDFLENVSKTLVFELMLDYDSQFCNTNTRLSENELVFNMPENCKAWAKITIKDCEKPSLYFRGLNPQYDFLNLHEDLSRIYAYFPLYGIEPIKIPK